MQIESRETPHSRQNRPEPNSVLTQFAASMNKKGLKELGSGVMALVFQSEKTGEVIKCFRRDSCYLAFLKIIAENKEDPHLPRIYQYENFKTPPFAGLHVVKMEKLIKVAEQYPWEDAAFELYQYFDIIQHGYQKDNPVLTKARKKLQYVMEDLPTDNSSIMKTVDLLQNIPKGCNADLHNGNTMRREDGTLVIIDPYI